MRSLPLEKVPRKRSTGGDDRARQLVYQLPKQDYNIKYANFVTDEKSHKSFSDMKRRLVRDSLGVGKMIFFLGIFLITCLDRSIRHEMQAISTNSCYSNILAISEGKIHLIKEKTDTTLFQTPLF